NTRVQELDYPRGDANVYTTYQGRGGVRLTPLRRLAFAYRFGDARLLLSSDISTQSRLLFARELLSRVRRIAPFLSYDQDPYLVDLFQIQAQVYATFHMRDPRVFYNREDVWVVPTELFGNETVRVEPYYVTMRLSGEQPEFILILPFAPSGRDNMIAWMAVRNDVPHYGEIVVYRFPKDRLVFGPMQVESRINQDPVISQQLTLWNQEGSRVLRGNLLIIPMENALMYVEPLFLQAERSQLPELKRVIVASGPRIVMEETLDAAVARLLGATPRSPQPPAGAAVPQ